MIIINLSLLEFNKDIINDLKDLYKQLNENLSNEFEKDLDEIKNTIYIIIIDNKIIGCGTIIFEKKLYHNGKKVAHLEDIIINKNYQGLGLGKKLLDFFINLSKENNCYKIILDCNQKLIPFYNKVNFEFKNIQMSKYI